MRNVQFEVGPLPKIEGAGRRSGGKWPGHSKEASALKALWQQNPEDTETFVKIASDLKVHTASRIASLINKGIADDFKPDTTGHYEARTRRTKTNPGLYDLWARYVYTGPEQPRRRRAPKKATGK